MALGFKCFAALLFTVSLTGSNSEQNSPAVQANITEQASSLNQTSGNDTEVDTSFVDPMVRLMNASSIEEALALNILYKDDHPATPADLGAVRDNATGKLLVSGDFGPGGFAVPDGCHPRDTTVEINVKNLDSTSRLYPRCVKVTRCGGCCGTPNVQCVGDYKERQVFNLIQLRMSGGPSGISVMGRYPIELETHVTCKCECSLSQEKCGSFRYFDPSACTCTCQNHVRCLPPYMFNPETCGCECAVIRECCSSGTDCGFAFNHQTCECDVARILSSSSNSGNLTQSNIDSYVERQQDIMAGGGGDGSASSSNNNNNNSPQQQAQTTTPEAATTTTTTTTTTTPEATTTTQVDCSNLTCPPNFRKVDCSCRRISSQQSRPRSRPRPRRRG